MKILTCSDSHLDLVSEGLLRNKDIDRVMNEIIDYAIEKEVDYFIFCGDSNMGNKPSVNANTIMVKWFRRLEENRILTRWLIGNHDVINEKGRCHNLEPLQAFNWEYIEIIDDFTVEEDCGWNLLYLPYISQSKIKENEYESLEQYYLDKFEKEDFDEDKIIAFSHLDIFGAKQGSEMLMIKGKKQNFPKEIVDDSRVKIIVNGHYHSNQKIGTKIYCPGSFESNNFGERDDIKGFYLMDL